MSLDNLGGDVNVQGTLSCKTFVPPASCITDAAIAAASNVDDAKLKHRHRKTYYQAPGSAVVAGTAEIHITKVAGSLLSVQATITGAVADDASRHVQVNLKRSTGGGSYATMLTAVIDLTSSSVLRTVYSGTIPSPALAVGDLLQVVVTVSGGSGNQAQGLLVDVEIMEPAV